jgi:uncharacterized protein (DUF362 family)
MKKARVILREQPDYRVEALAARAAEIISALGLSFAGKTVFLKPSFVYPSKSQRVKGIITQPELVAGVARALRDGGARRVLVGESSVLGPSRVSFHSVGILPLLKGIAEPVYLDEEELVEVEVPDPFVQDKFMVPRIWLEADAYVSLPKIKTNMFAEVTLSVKNNLGLLRQRDRLLYHDHRLHQKLADLFKIRPPDLVISDCIVAGQGQGPLMAEPVELGLLLGGDNAVAVDVVACRLTGYRPDEIEHLRLLIAAGYGPGSIAEIDLVNPALLERGRAFKRPELSISGLSPSLRVFQGTENACPSGCLGLVRGVVDAYLDRDGPDGLRPFNVILGNPIAALPADLDPEITLVLGDCAAPFQDRGAYVGGCCPRPLDVGMVVRRILGPMEVEIGLKDVMAAYLGHHRWRLSRLVAGKSLPPMENHVNFSRVVTEYFHMKNLHRKYPPPT